MGVLKTMSINQRLNKLYDESKSVTFNNDSKFIFLSDCHRGDNSISDEFAHNQTIYLHALNYYFSEGYTYFEVGDGDELWEHNKFSLIREAHSDVYMKLKEFHDANRFYYFIGNHNVEFSKMRNVEKKLYYFFDEYTEQHRTLFEGIETYESLILKHEESGSEIFVIHGHQGELFNDYLWIIAMLMLRYVWRYLHIIGFKNPSSPAKNKHKRHKVEKKLSKWIVANKKILLAGHTHRPKFPLPGDVPYFNDGCCIHPRNITGIEIVNGEIMMVDWRIRTDAYGVLKIEKKVNRGPIKLEDYWKQIQDVEYKEPPVE